MLHKTPILMILAGTLVVLSAQPLTAATVVVGTCLPAYPHFSTIQAAINALPLGGTVLVCPGKYPEQIRISHPITLKGVESSGSNLALITMPSGGTGTQVYVHDANVNISDLTIDGRNNGATNCGQGPNGIVYLVSSGTINHVSVRNEIPRGRALRGCFFDGNGIYVATRLYRHGASNVTIENSSIHAFQSNGIEANGRGTSVTVKNNSIGGNTVGPTSNGVAVVDGATGTITGNSIINVLEPVSFPNLFGGGYGILVGCSQGVTISGNTIGDTQVGISISSGCASLTGNADGNTIYKNTIFQTHIFDAVYVCGNSNLVQGNTINSTSEAAIRFDGSCNNPGVAGFFNTFTGNTVNDACTTSLVDPAVSGLNTIDSNTSYNVNFDQLSGTVLPARFCSSSGAPAFPVHSGGLGNGR
jgi:hypothetical protein